MARDTAPKAIQKHSLKTILSARKAGIDLDDRPGPQLAKVEQEETDIA